MDADKPAESFTKFLRKELGEGLISVVLFGSYARGEARPESDIDLLIVLETAPKSQMERIGKMRELLNRFNKDLPVSFITLTQEEAGENKSFFLDMTVYSKIFYDKGRFFEKRMEALKQRLKELGSRRIKLEDGSWYWDLKPDLKFGEEFTL